MSVEDIIEEYIEKITPFVSNQSNKLNITKPICILLRSTSVNGVKKLNRRIAEIVSNCHSIDKTLKELQYLAFIK